MIEINNKIWIMLKTNTLISDQSISVYRIILMLWILLFQFDHFNWIGELPDFLMNEKTLSLANLIRHYPSTSLLLFLDFTRLLCVVFILLGIKTRISGVLFFIISIYCKSYQYSLGKIDHDFVFYLLILVMSFSGWGYKLALVPDKKIRYDIGKLSITIISICVCWGMFTAGFQKILIWIDFDLNTSGIMRWFTSGYYTMGRDRFLASYLLDTNWFILELGDYFAAIFEVTGFIFLFRSKKSFLIWVLFAISFHFMNILILNINSFSNIFVYLLFVDYSNLYSLIKNLIAKNKKLVVLILASIILFRLYDVFAYSSHLNLLFHFFNDPILIHLIFGLVVWPILGFLIFMEIKKTSTLKK